MHSSHIVKDKDMRPFLGHSTFSKLHFLANMVSLLCDKTFKEATLGTNAEKVTQRCVSRGYVFRADRTKKTTLADAWAFVYMVERMPMKRKS
jgi:hypothetical protein